MELPTVSVWSAGVRHDQDTFNEISYALDFLLSPPECHVRQTTVQAVPTGITTATAITFNNLVKDNDTMWDAATPTYITIQTPGWYEIEYGVCWATKSDTTLRTQSLYLNGAMGIGSAVSYAEYTNEATGTKPQIRQSYDYFLNAGDRLYLGVMQTSGASLNTASSAAAGDQQTYLRVRWASL